MLESFSPDFYLPELDLYVEITTLKQRLVRKKNRKLRRLRELYPGLRVKLLYARDFRALLLKYGRISLADALTGAEGQATPPRPRLERRGSRRRPVGRPPPPMRRSRCPAASRAGRSRRTRAQARGSRGRPDHRRARHGDARHERDAGPRRATSPRSSSPRSRSRPRSSSWGARISADFDGRELTLVSVLKGSLPFMADLMRAITIPVQIDLMEVSSYGGTATESSGLVRILKDLSSSIDGRDVLIVEDIIDTGPHPQLPRPLPARQEPVVAPHLHPARQARPAPRRDPHRLPGLRDPGPVRDRLRARLRRALPQPPLRGRPPPRGLRGPRMTLHRRPLGRGRLVAAVSAILMLVGCVLPWFRAGGSDGIPPIEGNAFEGPGILVFLAALATLALVALPYAAGDRPVAYDRWWAYAAAGGRGGRGARSCASPAIAAEAGGLATMLPDRAPGLWLAARRRHRPRLRDRRDLRPAPGVRSGALSELPERRARRDGRDSADAPVAPAATGLARATGRPGRPTGPRRSRGREPGASELPGDQLARARHGRPARQPARRRPRQPPPGVSPPAAPGRGASGSPEPATAAARGQPSAARPGAAWPRSATAPSVPTVAVQAPGRTRRTPEPPAAPARERRAGRRTRRARRAGRTEADPRHRPPA